VELPEEVLDALETGVISDTQAKEFIGLEPAQDAEALRAITKENTAAGGRPLNRQATRVALRRVKGPGRLEHPALLVESQTHVAQGSLWCAPLEQEPLPIALGMAAHDLLALLEHFVSETQDAGGKPRASVAALLRALRDPEIAAFIASLNRLAVE
jgi:hypothetical protein